MFDFYVLKCDKSNNGDCNFLILKRLHTFEINGKENFGKNSPVWIIFR